MCSILKNKCLFSVAVIFGSFSQVALLKKRCKGVADAAPPPENEVPQSEDIVDSGSAPQTPSKEQETEAEVTEGKLSFKVFTCVI